MCSHLRISQVIVVFSIVGFSSSQYPPIKGGLPFKVPADIISSNGSLDLTLDVDIGNATVDWLTVSRRLYNNSFPGPTIRIKAGDRVNLKLVNSLKDPDYTSDEHSVTQKPNTTNLHTHGLHISSEEPQDSQLVEIPPNGSYQYRYEINDEQPAGTYWYHPHIHGSTHFQTQSGMHGMLIVEDDPDEPIAAIEDFVMVTSIFQYLYHEGGGQEEHCFITLQEDIHDYEGFRLNDTLENWLRNETNEVRYMLVNGQLRPTLELEAGIFKRFRIVNTAGLYALAISITGNDGNMCDVYEIALDGVYLPEARVAHLGRSLVNAGGRLDLLIKCETAGSYQVKSTFIEEDERSFGGHPQFSGELMTLDVVGNSTNNNTAPPELPALPSFLDDLRNIPSKDIDGRFAVEITPLDQMNREDYSGGHYWRYKAEVGTIQEMTLTNTQADDGHPIHMHINHMQVISYNEYTGPVGMDNGHRQSAYTLYDQSGQVCTYQHSGYNESEKIEFESDALEYIGHEDRFAKQGNDTLGYAQIGEWRDVILVPPLSNITVRFRTHQYTGPVLIHCHLTGDSDEGMMEVIGIVPKGSNLDANITSAGAYPWSCMENYPIGLPLERSANVTTENPDSSVETTTPSSTIATVITTENPGNDVETTTSSVANLRTRVVAAVLTFIIAIFHM